ncbi:MAG: TlpA family protein disulfide reductase [bacterium]|nr:TlpA family protein disulfide reductase [bacterium]
MRRLALFGTALVFACLVFGCSAEKQEAAKPEPTTSEPSIKVTTTETPAGTTTETPAGTTAETPAVEFAVWSATDTYGNLRQATEWVGKRPTIINFWGTWCPPCRKEIPDLIKLYAEYNPKGVEILGFAVRDEATNVNIFTKEAGMKWVMMMGNEEVLDKYGPITGVPTTVFLDANGQEVDRYIGPPTLEQFRASAEKALVGYEHKSEAM